MGSTGKRSRDQADDCSVRCGPFTQSVETDLEYDKKHLIPCHPRWRAPSNLGLGASLVCYRGPSATSIKIIDEIPKAARPWFSPWLVAVRPID